MRRPPAAVITCRVPSALDTVACAHVVPIANSKHATGKEQRGLKRRGARPPKIILLAIKHLSVHGLLFPSSRSVTVDSDDFEEGRKNARAARRRGMPVSSKGPVLLGIYTMLLAILLDVAPGIGALATERRRDAVSSAGLRVESARGCVGILMEEIPHGGHDLPSDIARCVCKQVGQVLDEDRTLVVGIMK